MIKISDCILILATLFCSDSFCYINLLPFQITEHLEDSIVRAESLSSRIDDEVLQISGMSSPKVRHLLNNICSIPGINYLEVGVWKGSTFVSALYRNSINSAIAIDNWVEFGGPKVEFAQNLKHFLKGHNIKVIERYCFETNLSLFNEAIDVFLYDGRHDFESQRMAFHYFNPIFSEIFIAIVDDYNWYPVEHGTQAAFAELGYNVLFEKHLRAPFGRDVDNDTAYWWNGLYVALISK